jgi:ribosome-binding protein aMBF1 (putative translation factor)
MSKQYHTKTCDFDARKIIHKQEKILMKLGQYLKENHLKAKMIAEKIGTTESVVSGWVHGKNIPRKETIKKIEKLTFGKVKITDWFSD